MSYFLQRFVLLWFVASVILVAGCSSNKRKELTPKPIKAISKENAEVKVHQQWLAMVGSGPGKFYHQFALASDSQAIYAASSDGSIKKINKFDGKTVWRLDLKEGITAGVSIDDKYAYVGSASGDLVAIDLKTGIEAWRFALKVEMVSVAVINGDNIVVNAVNGSVFSIHRETHEQRWRFDTNLPALTIRGSAKPLFVKDLVVIGTANGKVLLLDAQTGALRGDPKITEPDGDSEIERIIDIDATPLLNDNKLYVVSYQGALVVLDLQSGRISWSSKESSYRDISMGFGNAYVISDDSTLLAYDRRSGDVKWVQEDFMRRKLSAAAVSNSYVLFGDYKGYIHVISQVDGKQVARVNINGLSHMGAAVRSSHTKSMGSRAMGIRNVGGRFAGVRSKILVEGDVFYALANNGKLRSYRLESIK